MLSQFLKEAVSWDVILWNSIIFGCSHNRRGRVILEFFRLMEEGVKTDLSHFKVFCLLVYMKD